MRHEVAIECTDFLWIMALLSILLSSPSHGEEAQDHKEFKVYTLGEVVVSAKKEHEDDTAISYELTAEQIEATNSHSVAQALRYVPGLNVLVGRKSEPDVSIHGFDQSQIQVLIDGVPYYETNFGKLDLNQITTANVSKIVIEKGNQSVLYGANGEGGVINIITKKPSEKPSFAAKLEVGEKNAQVFTVSHGMKKGILNYWLSYTYRNSDATRLSKDFEPRLGTITYRPGGTVTTYLEDGGHFRDNSDYKSHSLWAKLGVEPSEDSEYYANFHYVASKKGFPSNLDTARVFPSKPAFSYLGRMQRYDDWGVDLSGSNNISERLTLKGKLFYHNHVDDYASYYDVDYTDKIAVSRYKDYLIGGMLLSDYMLTEWNSIRMAVHYRGDSHKERDDDYLPFAESFSYTGSIALENVFTYVDNLTIVAGISYDWFKVDKAEKNVTDRFTGDFLRQESQEVPDTQDEFNPMIGITYSFSDSTRIFASVARKTRFPTLGQLYSSRSGNVNLKAEKSINYTVGISTQLGKTLQLEFAPFHHDISDRISRDAPHVAGTYQNYAKVKMTGFEVSACFRPFKDVSLKAAYTYNNARDRSDGRVTDKVADIPKHKVDVAAKYTIPRLGTNLDLNMTYVSSTYSELPTPTKPDTPVLEADSYTVFDAKITQPFMKHTEAFLSINNIFDKYYEPQSGYPAPGRTFWLGISAKY